MQKKIESVANPTACASCPVRKMALFRPLDGEHLQWSQQHRAAQIHLPPRSTIYVQEDPMEQVYTVFSGWVLLYRTGKDGQRQILHVALPGDLIGTQAQWEGALNHSAVSVTDATLCAFPVNQLRKLLIEEHALALELSQIVSRDLELGRYHLENIGRRNALQALAFLLLELFYRCHARCATIEGVLDLPLTQDELGDALGLTNVHVSRKMTELERDGMIERSGQTIFFRDLPAMMELAQFKREMIQTKPLL